MTLLPVYHLTQAETCWLFVSDSAEPRHLHDIVYAVDVLRHRGVPQANIIVFADGELQATHLKPYGMSDVHPVASLPEVIASLSKATSLVLVSTGHGTEHGIGRSGGVLTPHQLVAAIRACPNVTVAAVVLCQCFAGVFNLVDATTEPPLVVIGATNLNMSLSIPLALAHPLKQADGTDGLQRWSANIFMAEFFRWIGKPVDVDGDGWLTLADAYKAAGVSSNHEVRRIKAELFLEAHELAEELRALKSSTSSDPRPQSEQLRAQGLRDLLDQHLQMLHLHQEPWLMNGRLAPQIRVF
jgi:hypothetical protein